ncbi:unnamed protein product, partial [Arctogadus glacialis]
GKSASRPAPKQSEDGMYRPETLNGAGLTSAVLLDSQAGDEDAARELEELLAEEIGRRRDGGKAHRWVAPGPAQELRRNATSGREQEGGARGQGSKESMGRREGEKKAGMRATPEDRVSSCRWRREGGAEMKELLLRSQNSRSRRA